MGSLKIFTQILRARVKLSRIARENFREIANDFFLDFGDFEHRVSSLVISREVINRNGYDLAKRSHTIFRGSSAHIS